MNAFFTFVSFAMLVASALAGRKIRDQKQCIKDNLAEIADKCKDKLPEAAQDKLKECVDAEEANGQMAKLAECLNKEGITDDSNCIQKPEKQGHFGDDIKEQLSDDDKEALKPFADCAKEVHDGQKNCEEGCPAPNLHTKRKIAKCALPLLRNKGQKSQLATCIHDALNGS